MPDSPLALDLLLLMLFVASVTLAPWVFKLVSSGSLLRLVVAMSPSWLFRLSSLVLLLR